MLIFRYWELHNICPRKPHYREAPLGESSGRQHCWEGQAGQPSYGRDGPRRSVGRPAAGDEGGDHVETDRLGHRAQGREEQRGVVQKVGLGTTHRGRDCSN